MTDDTNPDKVRIFLLETELQELKAKLAAQDKLLEAHRKQQEEMRRLSIPLR